MNLREAFSMSWRAIRSSPLRSTLTTLGVIIGVAAVITFVILGASLQADVVGEVGGGEAERVYVWNGHEEAEARPGSGSRPAFTEHDLDQLRSMEGVSTVSPYSPIRVNHVEHAGDTVASNDAVATDPEYFAEGEIEEGRAFESGEPEVVMTPLAAEQFEQDVGVGDTVTVAFEDGSEAEVRVVGILEDSTSRGPFEGFGESGRIYLPADPFYLTTVESPAAGTDQRAYPSAVVVANDPETVTDVRARTEAYLTDGSDAAALLPSEFAVEVRTNQDVLDRLNSLLTTLTGFVTGVALISLLVGSIGIANVMLVSVTERTREIGIMKTVGARNRDVLGLFLVEAIVLGAIGAIVGTAVGFGAGYLAATLLELPFVAPLEWAAVAVVVGPLVGALSGLYPAWNAARTDPIEALRYE
ncbi:ABC transporter permease [Halalkalicoccus salilacus]|uniref:ABC transporter permease n=1 Tax=Halalkalicoccus salilacus TaxID=3117459 RepID=UPI00300F6496